MEFYGILSSILIASSSANMRKHVRMVLDCLPNTRLRGPASELCRQSPSRRQSTPVHDSMILRHLFSGVSGGFRQKCGINLPENIQSAARFPTLKFDPWILGHRWLWASWMDFVALWLTLAHFGSFCQFKATLGERTFSSFFSTSSRSFRCWVSDSPSPGSQDLSHSSKSGSFSSTSPEKKRGRSGNVW